MGVGNMMKKRTFSQSKILCVDDDEAIRDLLSRILKSWEFTVQVVSSAKEAIKKIQQVDFDLVITDFKMPDMNGRDLAKIVKEKNPQCPVILFTGFSISLDSEVEKENGIDAIIHKPCSMNTIHREIVKCLKIKNEREISKM
jgi:two-component system response regulator HydG